MQVTRLTDAKPYEAPKHFKMEALRLQGAEASNIEDYSCSLSYFLPGGGAERAASPNEKVYVVVDGEITIITDDEEVTLGKLDSCLIGNNEFRTVENRSNTVATMLVIVSS